MRRGGHRAKRSLATRWLGRGPSREVVVPGDDRGGGMEIPVQKWKTLFFRLLNAPPTVSLLLRTFWALSCRWMEDRPPPEREVQLSNL